PLVMPVENPTGRLDNLSVPPALEFGRLGTALWIACELLDATKHPLNQRLRRFRVIQRDVIGNCLEIAQRRLGPDYFRHRVIRCFAFACDTTRPSSIAFSPRAMPSRRLIRRWSVSYVSTSTRYALGKPC